MQFKLLQGRKFFASRSEGKRDTCDPRFFISGWAGADRAATWRVAEYFTISSATADAHDHSAVRHDLGHRVVFSQPKGMPHRQNVEGATQPHTLGLRGKPQAELHPAGQAFPALALAWVHRRPQRVASEFDW